MILVTGGAGFIGSAYIWHLNRQGITGILVADRLHSSNKWKNLTGLQIADYIDRSGIFAYLEHYGIKPETVIHMGACSSTIETNADYIIKTNFDFSKKIWEYCSEQKIKLIYASSAATYGDGSAGYCDQHDLINRLRPLNIYGFSKHFFDQWALGQTRRPPFYYGLKFFNVFGPNEYHKQQMSSVLFHAYNDIKNTGKCRLFKSHRSDIPHGEQKRDFIYVKDIVKIIDYFRINNIESGIYNAGSGVASSFKKLITSLFTALGKK
ncbi:MAG: ADP-glyceromanno-heptose 6-epimerase, partial [Spirochaetes bacterium GWF1_41_5]